MHLLERVVHMSIVQPQPVFLLCTIRHTPFWWRQHLDALLRHRLHTASTLLLEIRRHNQQILAMRPSSVKSHQYNEFRQLLRIETRTSLYAIMAV